MYGGPAPLGTLISEPALTIKACAGSAGDVYRPALMRVTALRIVRDAFDDSVVLRGSIGESIS